METLIDLNCEDVMIELVFRYLLNGHHLMVHHRHQIADAEPYRKAAVAFLGLSPRCCSRPLHRTREWVEEMAHSGTRVLDLKRKDESRRFNGMQGDIAMNTLVQEVKINYGNPNESLYGNCHAYLCDARFEIVTRAIVCTNWTSKYDSITPPKKETNNNTKETKEIDNQNHAKEQDSLISVCTSGYETLRTSDTSEKEPLSITTLYENYDKSEYQEFTKEHDSLTFFEKSSEYDSFKYKTEEGEYNDEYAEESFRRTFVKRERAAEYECEVPLVRSWRSSAESIIGPLLSSLLKKAASLLEAELVVNWRVTGTICRLMSFPTPLLTSLLCPGFVVQPNVPSLFHILNKLKEELDELTSGLDNINELMDKARVFLIQREMSLAKSRGPIDTHVKPEKSPFRQVETKRRGISSSLSNMFGRRLSSSSTPPQNAIHHQQAYNTFSPQKSLVFTQEAYWNQSITLRSVLNAVILDEWVKELAAICEEHALRLSSENYDEETYISMVAL